MVPTVSSFPTTATTYVPQQWQEQYPNAHEEVPSDAPTPLGRPVNLTVHVDASHASNLINRRSVTGHVVRSSQWCSRVLAFQGTKYHRNIYFWI